jgi:hypothetical protein
MISRIGCPDKAVSSPEIPALVIFPPIHFSQPWPVLEPLPPLPPAPGLPHGGPIWGWRATPHAVQTPVPGMFGLAIAACRPTVKFELPVGGARPRRALARPRFPLPARPTSPRLRRWQEQPGLPPCFGLVLPRPLREERAPTKQEETLKQAKVSVDQWKKVHRQQPENVTAISGLAAAEEYVRIAKSTVDAGRAHSERLQSAVSRQAQRFKEVARHTAEHSSVATQLESSATRLSAAQALLHEAEAILLSLQVEAMGPPEPALGSTPPPSHLLLPGVEPSGGSTRLDYARPGHVQHGGCHHLQRPCSRPYPSRPHPLRLRLCCRPGTGNGPWANDPRGQRPQFFLARRLCRHRWQPLPPRRLRLPPRWRPRLPCQPPLPLRQPSSQGHGIPAC